MLKKIALVLTGILFGLGIAFALIILPVIAQNSFISPLPHTEKQVIGFLPYWLLGRARADYSSAINTLTYFALRINPDGSIQKYLSAKEAEPGYHALFSGKIDPFLKAANKHHESLSLAIDSGDAKTIEGLVATPSAHAKTLVNQVLPLMQKYGFSDLNLDIEYTASASAQNRAQFTTFLQNVKRDLQGKATLTVEISTMDVIFKNLIDVKAVSHIADTVVLMAYDYHSTDSFVTGPVAPIKGAGVQSEYDVTAAVAKSLEQVPPSKLILGIPLYGYEWETLGAIPRSAAIPGSGVAASNRRMESFLATCASCSAVTDQTAVEPYISYFSDDTNTNHIIFYPNEQSTAAKLRLAQQTHIAGVALWALGYEGPTILKPLSSYMHSVN